MTVEELETLIARGEGQTVEFKPFRGGISVSQLAETLVAFANAEGGVVLVGVEDDGTIAGISPTTENLDRLLNAARDTCHPSVEVMLTPVEVADKTVVAMKVHRSGRLHSHADGRVVLRVGSQDKRLLGDDILTIASARSDISYENEPVAQATLDDLDDRVIADYVRHREERLQERLTLNKTELLRALGLTTVRQGVELPNVAAVLLFGKPPDQFLVQSGLTVVRFAGTEPGSGPSGLPGYIRREDVNGPLVHCVERAWQVVWEEMRKEARVTGLVREEIPEYPPFAVREAVINAMAHRDWRVSGVRNQVRMFDDRLEVVSAGGLPGHVTPETMVSEQFSRNPRIVKVLYHWNYIEELGIGIDRMIRAMVEAGNPPPEFATTGHSVTVTLRSVRKTVSVGDREPWMEGLNERQIQAMSFARERGSITNREYRELTEVSSSTAHRDLDDLVQKELLQPGGGGRALVYRLSPPQ